MDGLRYTALTGGIGGAKFVLGLREQLAAGALDVIVNTGDDFDHLGLPICPDIDTLIYTLADTVNTETGWGLRDETWQFMDAIEALGGDAWFRLGDRDLVTHVARRDMLAEGMTLSAATTAVAEQSGITTRLHPMTDQPLRTIIETADGELDFQDYFVRQQARPVAAAIHYRGEAAAAPGAVAALDDSDLGGILIAPSNPWLSIGPILAVPGIVERLAAATAPVVVISPLVGGEAIKGPTAKLMDELAVNRDVTGIAEHYRGVIDGIVIDKQDDEYAAAIEAMGLRVAVTDTIMNNLADKVRLAGETLAFCRELAAD